MKNYKKKIIRKYWILPIAIYLFLMVINGMALFFIHNNFEKKEKVLDIINSVDIFDKIQQQSNKEICIKHIDWFYVLEINNNINLLDNYVLKEKFKEKIIDVSESINQIKKDKSKNYITRESILREKIVIFYRNSENKILVIVFDKSLLKDKKIVSLMVMLISVFVYILASIPIYVALKRYLDERGREIEEQAMTDYLTGLFNRRACFIFLKKLFKIAERNSESISVIFLDLDNLKNVNDNYGHDAGDFFIKKFVECVKKVLRNSDIFSRIGGDEFLIVLPNCVAKDAKIIAEKIKYEISVDFEALKYDMDFSYGIAESNIENRADEDKIIKMADNRMYQHKIFKKYKKKLEEQN